MNLISLKKPLFILLIFGIIAVPLSSILPVLEDDPWYPQYLVLTTLFFIAASIILWAFNKYISIFTLLALFSTVFIAKQQPHSIVCLLQIYLCSLAMWGISFLDSKSRVWVVKAICLSALIQGIWVILQYFNMDPLFYNPNAPEHSDNVGFLGSKNQLALFMADSGPATAVLFPWALPFTIFGLWCSKTTAAWVAFGTASLFLASKNKKKLWIVACVIVLGTAIFLGKFEYKLKDSIQERLNVYQFVIQSIYQGKVDLQYRDPNNNMEMAFQSRNCNPFLGFGLGTFTQMSPFFEMNGSMILGNTKDSGRFYEHVHNDYLEILFEMGIIGFLSLMAIIGHLFVQYIRTPKTKMLNILFACLLAHLICSLGIYTVFTAPSGLLLVVIYGLFQGEVNRPEAVSVNPPKSIDNT